MKRNLNLKSGYVGLLVLLISVAIGIFLVWTIYQRLGIAPNAAKTIPQGLNAIDQAEKIKDLIESRNDI